MVEVAMMHDQVNVARTGAGEVQVPLHDAAAFAGMHRAGQLAAAVLDMITPAVRPGVTTGELDRLCNAFILDHGAVPAPLNYRGYPKSICTSINQEVCHGIPSEDRVLREGDILNIDVTVILDGWHGDTSRMFFAGEPKVKARRLCQVTFEAMWEGIRAVRPGARLSVIGFAIQNHAEKFRYSVVQDYCGHGIGRVFHDAPSVLHYHTSRDKKSKKERQEESYQILRQRDLVLQPGMIFTIEPMINAGSWDAGGWRVKLSKEDGWTVVTRDGEPSAQFEHTVGVTEDGCEVFTLSPAGLHHPPW
jgi:methionyl aminopeptidase